MLGHFYDPDAPLTIDAHNRPHWSQDGAIVFVTFRTHDSIPREVIERWNREKAEYLRRRGIVAKSIVEAVEKLSAADRRTFHKQFNRQREICSDQCFGRCLLRRPDLARIVADSLMYFDKQRYNMGDFVVMPDHVHLLAAFYSAEQMREQFDSWLHWTAREINKATGSRGQFWQEEPFDHLVRNLDQYETLRRYIRDNPRTAGLSEGEYLYRRYEV